jgi:hypothetical protein
MSGVSVIRHLLANNAAVLAVVPASRIMAGALPLKTTLPAISVTQISGTPENLLRINEHGKMHADRVQVTWLFSGTQASPAGSGYPGVKALGQLILAACPSQRGTVNSVAVDSISPGSEGPDIFDDERSLYAQSRDFFVKWTGA